MNRTWEFSDAEFVTRWLARNESSLPKPLFALGRYESLDHAIRDRHSIRARIAANPDPSFDGVLDIVARPEIRIVVDGQDYRRADRREGWVRALGVRRGSRGFLLTQRPGETVLHSGGFVVEECEATDLADLVVGVLPDVAAGVGEDIELVGRRTEMDYRYRQTVINDAYDDSVTDRSAQWLDAKVDTLGNITISQAESAFGPRGRQSHTLTWRDVAGDGRYVIAANQVPAVAMAADSRRVVLAINTCIAEVVKTIRDERRSTAR
jgi:hypothetical protein